MKKILLVLGLLFVLIMAENVNAEKAYRCYYQIGVLAGYSTIESATSTNYISVKENASFSRHTSNGITVTYQTPTECPATISIEPATTTVTIIPPEKCLDDSCKKIIVNNNYCRKQFGNNAQYNDISKGCACKTGYELKTDPGATVCRPAPVVSKPITSQVAGASTTAEIVAPASMTREQLLNKINEIVALINQLKAQLAAMGK